MKHVTDNILNLFEIRIMRRFRILYIITFLLCNSAVYSQGLKSDYVDEFTGDHVRTTTWSRLYMKSGLTAPLNVYYKFSNVSDDKALVLKFMMVNNVFSIEENAELLIKLENGKVLTLNNLRYTISTAGGGAVSYFGSKAQGLTAIYLLDDDDIRTLSSNIISKIRFHYTYISSPRAMDISIKKKKAKGFMESIKLIEF